MPFWFLKAVLKTAFTPTHPSIHEHGLILHLLRSLINWLKISAHFLRCDAHLQAIYKQFSHNLFHKLRAWENRQIKLEMCLVIGHKVRLPWHDPIFVSLWVTLNILTNENHKNPENPIVPLKNHQKIMTIVELQSIITKIIKLLESNARIRKIIKILELH